MAEYPSTHVNEIRNKPYRVKKSRNAEFMKYVRRAVVGIALVTYGLLTACDEDRTNSVNQIATAQSAGQIPVATMPYNCDGITVKADMYDEGQFKGQGTIFLIDQRVTADPADQSKVYDAYTYMTASHVADVVNLDGGDEKIVVSVSFNPNSDAHDFIQDQEITHIINVATGGVDDVSIIKTRELDYEDLPTQIKPLGVGNLTGTWPQLPARIVTQSFPSGANGMMVVTEFDTSRTTTSFAGLFGLRIESYPKTNSSPTNYGSSGSPVCVTTADIPGGFVAAVDTNASRISGEVSYFTKLPDNILEIVNLAINTP